MDKDKLKNEIHKEIKIYSDARTVIHELRTDGAWKIGNSQLDTLKNDCRELFNELKITKNIDLEWIPRNRNPAGKALEGIQKYAKLHFKTKKPNYLYKAKKKSK